ncbi:MAG: transcriptional regulator BetI [Roseovarius sp.]
MSRTRIRDIRHDELIDAAITATHDAGFAVVTMADIARRAGASAASINYYFGSKEKLMEAAMRRVMSTLRHCVIERLKQATTPEERLYAVVCANFDDRLFTARICSFWVQFWAHAPYAKSLSRLHRINRLRVQSHVRTELRTLVSPELREPLRESIQAYMDGIWVEVAQNPRPTDPARARDTARQVVATLLDGARG